MVAFFLAFNNCFFSKHHLTSEPTPHHLMFFMAAPHFGSWLSPLVSLDLAIKQQQMAHRKLCALQQQSWLLLLFHFYPRTAVAPLNFVFTLACWLEGQPRSGAWLLSLEEWKETWWLLNFCSEVFKVSHVAKLYFKWTWIYAVLERGSEYFE